MAGCVLLGKVRLKEYFKMSISESLGDSNSFGNSNWIINFRIISKARSSKSGNFDLLNVGSLTNETGIWWEIGPFP